MGNCLVIQDRKEIKVMSIVDEEILKALPPPISFPSKGAVFPPSSHGFSGTGSDDAAEKKAPSAAAADVPGAMVRVKLVISKQELRRMLGKDDQASLSLDDMMALMRRRAEQEEQESSCCRGWRPALHSIPEGSVICSTS
ncbi:uncharacterized protein LOC100842698 [Brachypodium distachyon]|uniref:Uncharacterized protein n=1 Tax=Brachypodium distachyon TaxID=15368 RepID=I1IUA0_BRADI|nr:uncharacterized protein LOC100842698 [Brachypodium distachyon]KQJ92215.1 hypothetical protein BRADI_4g42290v3 [Brachypodium distachyon]|eukprot:XP_003578896.1 uncharacterized protein LOC100842698 [Brachypodium distachyon]